MGVGLLAGCTPATDEVTKESLYAFQAATAVSILGDADFTIDGNTLPTIKYADGSETTDTEEVIEEEQVLDINKYIGIMEQLLSDDEAPIIVATEESDRPEYTYKLIVTTNYLTGESASYTIYYNELTPEEIEVISSEEITSEETSLVLSEPLGRRGNNNNNGNNGDKGNNDWCNGPRSDNTPTSEQGEEMYGRDFDMDDHEEFMMGEGVGELEQVRDEFHNHHGHGMGDHNEEGELINLEGIIIVDEVEYVLVGTQGENATNFFVSYDENNWMRIVQVVNDNMTKYMISQSIDGVMSRIAFKAQVEDDKVKVSLFILNDGVVVSYSFRKVVKDGQEFLFIRIIEDNVVTHVKATPTIDPETGETVYTYEFFESGHGFGFRGHHHGH